MNKMWQINVVNDGQPEVFEFQADNKALAHSHAMSLKHDPGFHQVLVSDNLDERVRSVAVRFVGWAE